MTPRPTEPPSDRRQQILEIALELFAQKGFASTTNAEIARRAGVTAAALYYYFPSKEELFKAAVTERREVVSPILAQLKGELLDLPPQVALPAFVQHMGQFLMEERTQAVLRIIMTEGPRNPEIARIYHDQVISQMAHFTLGYLNHQMEKGTIRRMAPQLLAMLLAGPLLTTVLTRDFIQFPIMQHVTNEALLQQITETLIPALLTELP